MRIIYLFIKITRNLHIIIANMGSNYLGFLVQQMVTKIFLFNIVLRYLVCYSVWKLLKQNKQYPVEQVSRDLNDTSALV